MDIPTCLHPTNQFLPPPPRFSEAPEHGGTGLSCSKNQQKMATFSPKKAIYLPKKLGVLPKTCGDATKKVGVSLEKVMLFKEFYPRHLDS